ncbi:hypothetical protein RUND412_010509 [Rhizina undulata]
MMMAAASLPPTVALTPPSSSRGGISGLGDWEFSVPIHGIDNHESTSRAKPLRTPADNRPLNNDSPHRAKGALPGVGNPNVYIVSGRIHANDRHPEQQTLTKHENYNPRGIDDSMDPQRTTVADYLNPKPVRTRNNSLVSSNHDGDSVFDLYGAGSVYRHSLGGKYLTDEYLDGAEEDPEASKWICKEKLEKEEVEEEEASKWISKEKLEAEEEDPEASKWVYKEKLEQDEGWIHKEKLEKSEDPETSKWIYKEKLEMLESKAPVKKGEPQASRWIDSHKLAQIESRELHRAAINATSHSRNTSINTTENDEKKKRISSPVPPENVYEGMLFNPQEMNNDLRTPEEQALDAMAAHSASRPSRKGASSRIPLPTSSPTPIPQEFLERMAPLPRLLTSAHEERANISAGLPHTRRRSHSAGSAFLLDEVQRLQTPPSYSPSTITNPKTRGSMTPTSNRRSTASRTSASHLAKQRTRSNPQLYSRPGTSASYATHTSTIGGPNPQNKHNAPEGPPPWSLSSYKPDPSLPPDQQIIPTVAKRLQQEQWERDGVYASVYDKELRPLKVLGDEEVEKRQSQQGVKNEAPAWPLRSSTVPSETHETKQMEQEVDQNAGSDALPNLSENNTHNTTDSIPQPKSESRQSDDVERGKEKKKKKKFSCCTIM